MSELPLQHGPMGYFFHCPAGREIEFTELFDSDNGYRITVGFVGEKDFSAIRIELARELAMSFNAKNDQERRIAEILLRCADHTEKKQNAWLAAGKPEKPLVNGV